MPDEFVTPEDRVREALVEFCDAVDATGGVFPDGPGYSPANTYDEDDPEAGWYDLGHAYVNACKALGRDPLVDESLGNAEWEDSDDDEDDEDDEEEGAG